MYCFVLILEVKYQITETKLPHKKIFICLSTEDVGFSTFNSSDAPSPFCEQRLRTQGPPGGKGGPAVPTCLGI